MILQTTYKEFNMYKDYYDDIIPPENYEPEVLLELNIGKIETKLLFSNYWQRSCEFQFRVHGKLL